MVNTSVNPTTDAPADGAGSSLLDMLARVAGSKERDPGPPPMASPKNTIDKSDATPPLVAPSPPTPGRRQWEPNILTLADGIAAVIEVSAQPDHWLVYTLEALPAAQNLWLRPADNNAVLAIPPTFPAAFAEGAIPLNKAVGATEIPGRGRFLQLLAVGASPTVIAIAVTNLTAK